jgi:hypothetical protein
MEIQKYLRKELAGTIVNSRESLVKSLVAITLLRRERLPETGIDSCPRAEIVNETIEPCQPK